METGVVTILKVDKGSQLAGELLRFVEGFSWEEVRTHTAKRIAEWEFEDWETPFAAIAEERVIGMACISKTDYYFEKTHIPAEHTGLYEKYGYDFVGEIVNYGNGADRLYVKDISRYAPDTA